MGVAFLNPQDCLKHSISKQPLISHHMKNPRITNPNLNRSNRIQPQPPPNRRRRSPPRPNNNTSPPSRTMVVPTKNLIPGQVKILKRGEDLIETVPDLSPQKKIENPHVVKKIVSPLVLKKKMVNPEISDLGSDLGSTERLGPDPKLVPTQIRLTDLNGVATFYAGSACITSPPPSSLPLPAFFNKKCVSGNNNDNATSDLIRILRLDLQQ